MITDKTNQPKEYDVVLGGRASAPADGVALGGLERVKQMLVNGAVEQRIDVLDAFQYGQLGLDLVIQALDDKSEQVQEAAYWLLQDSTEPRVKLALQAYNPYLFFECLRTIEKYTDEVCRIGHVANSPKQQISVPYDYDGTIKVWNMQTRQVIHTFQQGETIRINRVVVTPNNQILGLRHCSTSFVEVWELKTGQKIVTTPSAPEMFWNVAISLDGHTLVSNGEDNIFNLWDIWTGRAISFIEISEELPDRYLIYSDSQILVTQNSDSLIFELWDWQTQHIIRTFNPHSYYIQRVAISLDGRLLLSGSGENGIIKVWNVRTGHELSTLASNSVLIRNLVTTSDGQTLLIYGEDDGTVAVWGIPQME